MGKINRLSPHVADLIAAGEVVERPASVVKELIENAIDAGAENITVELERGGMAMIRITDDGSGMAPDDAETAFLRHATSKISSKDDLYRIGTLGFRGEALAATAAVSKIEVATCLRGAEVGTRLELEKGVVTRREETGCPAGTTIVVKDLFFNTPARLKFIKKDAAEGNFAAATVEKCAIAHPEISFKLIKENATVLHTPGDSSLLSCLYCIYGKEFVAGLIKTQYEYMGVRLSGYITTPKSARGNRSMQHFFINARPVKNRVLSVALEEACKNSVMVGRFPSCFLNITIDPSIVDVNVHPTKSEVKFADERPVFDCIYFAVKSALTVNNEAVLGLHENKESAGKPETAAAKTAAAPTAAAKFAEAKFAETGTTAENNRPAAIETGIFAPAAAVPATASQTELFVKNEPPVELKHGILPLKDPKSAFAQPQFLQYATRDVQIKIEKEPDLVQQPADETQNTIQFRLIGELMKLYILAESEDRLIIIDKHAAHERMIYEELKKQRGVPVSQALIKPAVLNMSGNDLTIVLDHLEQFSKLGFEIEPFGAASIAVRQVPSVTDQQDILPLIEEIVEQLARDKKCAEPEIMDKMLRTVACKAAMKAGKATPEAELAVIVRRVLEDPDISYCPHGRPVKIVMDKKALEKQFGRIQP